MGRRLNVLVVDDEQIVLDSIHKHLRKEPYDLHTCLTAQEGLDLMKEVDIDIVLTDLMLPEIDGLEFMKIVLTDQPNLPVIMVTGYATINTALQATHVGAFDYVAKPFTRKELIAVVRRAADLVLTADGLVDSTGDIAGAESARGPKGLGGVGENSWLMPQEDETVLLGVKRSFLRSIGHIQNIFLPEVGDELRQGSEYLQIFSADLNAYTVPAPLSGTVVAVNDRALASPKLLLVDPIGGGWLIRLKPSRFESEMKELGL